MAIYHKSNTFLIIGMIYSLIFAVCIAALGVYFINTAIVNLEGAMDPIMTLFIGIGRLFGILLGVFFVAFALVSLADFVFAINAYTSHKRIFYKLCKIFGGVTINPFSIIGANMGLKICHNIKIAKEFLEE